MDFVTATYRLRCSTAEAPDFAQQIALEQTVEVPEQLLNSPDIREQVVGRVRSLRQVSDAPEVHEAVIQYPAAVAGSHAGQMWNLLYGNISLKRTVRLVGVELPDSLRPLLPGPKFGISGLRNWLGIERRPLLATALKPKGSADEQFAVLAQSFAKGGGDVVKDDHNLVDASFEQFCRRVDLAQSAVEKAAQQTGRLCLYAPNLSPPIHELTRYVDYLVGRNIQAALISPFLLGLDTVRHLAATSPLFLMAHPTFTGCYFHDPFHGIDPGVLLGQWFRLLGCDATIFPNYGGRFSFSAMECQSIVHAARETTDGRAGCWPAPAGGMAFDRLSEMSRDYGMDTMFLIGGALLSESADVCQNTARFAAEISALFPDGSHNPGASENNGFASACELPASVAMKPQLLERLAFRAGFQWDGRSAVAYKTSNQFPFAGVSRTELIGTHGEQTSFDVRYFEIEPGGYSSREKHRHTHVIIGLQGQGQLTIGERRIPLGPMDIAYVGPLEVHQLQNSGPEPFGFLCIVDHVRDRPQAP